MKYFTYPKKSNNQYDNCSHKIYVNDILLTNGRLKDIFQQKFSENIYNLLGRPLHTSPWHQLNRSAYVSTFKGNISY